jgi:hypothetical protein
MRNDWNSAVTSGDMATIDAQLAEEIEWDQMPYNNKAKGKKDVMTRLLLLEIGHTAKDLSGGVSDPQAPAASSM